LLHDSTGNLWVGTLGQGLWRVRQRPAQPAVIEMMTVETGLLNNGVLSLLEDEHGIWVGTLGGLNLLVPHRVAQIVNLGVVSALDAADDHSVWVGTARGLLRVRTGEMPVPIPPLHLPDLEVTIVHRAAGGNVWVVTSRGLGRVVGGRFVPLAGAESLSAADFTAVISDTLGRVWVSHRRGGVFTIENGRLTPHSSAAGRFEQVELLHADRSGRVWVVSDGGERLFTIDADGSVQPFRAAATPGTDPSPHGLISAILETSRGDLWFATGEGLLRLRHGRLDFVSTPRLLHGGSVTALAEDRHGMVWVGASAGILVFDPRQADAVIAGRERTLRSTLVDESDGVAGLSFRRFPALGSVRAPGGMLWFVTGRGLTVINPDVFAADSLATNGSVRIESITANERRLDAQADVSLPADLERLRIDYTALRVRWPNRIRFRYRLEGLDRDWTDAGITREATYTNLKPGKYRFHVVATSEKDSGLELVASWPFSVAPAFYQTWTFIAAIAGLVTVGLWVAWRLRLRQVRLQFARVLAERARLSREIHDTLLQSLVGVALQIGDATADIEHSPAEARAQLQRIRKRVEQYAAEAARTIRNLRSPLLDNLGLVGALSDVVQQAIAGAPIQARFSSSGTPHSLPDSVQHQLLRVTQEAVTNAVRHASASEVRVHVAFGPEHTTLTVSDDGVGFIATAGWPAGSHYGLAMMQERATEIRGRLSITSRPGEGTRVELSVPSRVPVAAA
jgi:signal transduction histidine kinase